MSDEEDVAQSFATDSDLFDAELESEPEGRNQHDDGNKEQPPVDEEEDEDQDDEGHDNDQEETLREENSVQDNVPEKKVRKSTKVREPKPRRMKKADVQQIHSESQRILRESTVRLPYHQPAGKDIRHFLQRVTVNKIQKNERNDQTTADSSEQDVEGIESEIVSPPPVETASQYEVVSDNTAVAPKLSAATDSFFTDDLIPMKKPAGVNHLMERFLKHNRTKSNNTVEEVPSREQQIADENEVVIVKEEGKPDERMKNKESYKPQHISLGNKLSSLKEKLQAHMKLKRAETRKIHESQRKIDNEEVSEEEEEEEEEADSDEETDEESDSKEDVDFEINEWNAEDDQMQEHYKELGNQVERNNEQEFEDTNTEDSSLHDESSSHIDIDIRDDKRNSVTKDPLRNKIHVCSEDRTMDLFPSDASNQNTYKTGELEEENDCDTKDSGESIKLRLDGIEDSQDATTKQKDNDTSSDKFTKLKFLQESSSDNSYIPPGQEWKTLTDKKENSYSNDSTDDIIPFSRFKRLFQNDSSATKDKKSRPLSELTLPVEDSQDLYEDEDTTDSKRGQHALNTSKEFSFALDEDTQFTQFVDTQGFLLSTTKKKKNESQVDQNESGAKSNISELLGLCSGTFSHPVKSKTNKETQQSNMDELLDLCSGKFTGQSKEQQRFDSGTNDTQETNDTNMSELLGLCSGQFTGLESSSGQETKDNQSKQKKGETESGIFNALEQLETRKLKPRHGLFAMFDAMGNENSLDDAVALCSGKFPTSQNRMDEVENSKDSMKELSDGNSSDENVFTDDEEAIHRSFHDGNEQDNEEEKEDDEEEEDEGDDGNGYDEEEEISLQRKLKASRKSMNPIFNKNNFLEEEAELSGSDASSDEEEGGDDDEFEEDSEVEDLPSDEELQRQVNKVHMKSVIDEDNRELRAFKERYLEDGDLYSEGGGRSRNFKWHGLDDSQLDVFNNKKLWGDEEMVDSELLSQDELERRKLKHEKDQFLQEQLTLDSENECRHVDENSQNILNLIRDTSSAGTDVKSCDEKPAAKPVVKPSDPKSTNSSRKRGSFLHRRTDQMSRLSSVTAAIKTPNSTRNFVFHTVSPTGKAKESSAKKLPRSVSLSEPPNAKRPRLERTHGNIATGSLFAIM